MYGGWDMGDAKSSYEQYSLSHGRTPGGGGTGGGGGGGGRWTPGRVFGQLFVISLVACLLGRIPLLLIPVAAAGVAGALTLAIYGIARLVSRGRE